MPNLSHQLACVVVVEEVGGAEVVGCVTVDVELEAVDEVDEAHDAITIESARTKVMAVRMTFSFIFLLSYFLPEQRYSPEKFF